MHNINIYGVHLNIGELVLQDREWSLIIVSGSSGSATIRGKNGRVLEKRDISLSGAELNAFLTACRLGLFDSLFP